jgi:DNA-binding transcriptional MerR regulator
LGVAENFVAGNDYVAENYSGKKAAEIVGISYRQLDYWARTDLVRPSVADAAGSGSRRQYSYGDLLELKVIKSMLDAGIKLESVREAFSFLREQLGTDIASAQLVIGGGSAILVRDDHELIDVLRRGQFVMTSILSLDGVQREIDAAIVDLFPSEAPAAERRAASGS